MKNKNKTIFRNELNLALDGTVSTGLLLVAQSGATAFSLNSRPPGVGLEFNVNGTVDTGLTSTSYSYMFLFTVDTLL